MKVLFLCTANSCRSILSEAVFNHLAPAGMKAYSAGSQPKGDVHPLSITALQRAGISTEGLSSKSSDAHAELAPDFVITVCDKAAGEACPVFFGPAVKAHWGFLTLLTSRATPPNWTQRSTSRLSRSNDASMHSSRCLSNNWMPPSLRPSWPVSERSDV